MRKLTQLAFAASTVLVGSSVVHAAVIIESEVGADRTKSLVSIENGKAKMQSDLVSYILIDPSANQYLYITPGNKQIVDMNAAPPADPAVRKITSSTKVTITHKGPGPVIAGYPTQLYQLFANGSLCLSTYLSREAMSRGDLKEFHAGFARMQVKQKQALRAAGAEYQACEEAQEKLTGRYPALGLAMRTVDAHGNLLQRVVNIDTNGKLAANIFDVPPGFSRITHEEFLRRMEGVNGAQPEPAK